MLSTTEKHANMISTINHAQISFFTKKIIFFYITKGGKIMFNYQKMGEI